jgi:hypothetical protein
MGNAVGTAPTSSSWRGLPARRPSDPGRAVPHRPIPRKEQLMRIAIYVRVSTQCQAEMQAID